MRTILISAMIFSFSCTGELEPIEVDEPLPGAITVSPESMDFGEMEILTEQVSYISIRNDGNGPLQVFDVAFSSDSQRPHWSLEGGLSGFLDPGQEIGLTITAHPMTLDSPNSGLMIRSDDPDRPEVSIPLSASVYALPELRVDPADVVELGIVAIGETGKADVIIGNDGYADLYVNQVSISNNSSAFDIEIDASGTTIPARSEDGRIRIRFTPISAGSFTETLTIETTDPVMSSWSLVIQGTGS